jgi:hypothetical protein
MPDEPNLPPAPPLRVTLIEAALLNHLHPVGRPGQTGCGVCHRPWGGHHGEFDIELCCQRCGVIFDMGCYLRGLATPTEVAWFKSSSNAPPPMLLCPGCPS